MRKGDPVERTDFVRQASVQTIITHSKVVLHLARKNKSARRRRELDHPARAADVARQKAQKEGDIQQRPCELLMSMMDAAGDAGADPFLLKLALLSEAQANSGPSKSIVIAYDGAGDIVNEWSEICSLLMSSIGLETTMPVTIHYLPKNANRSWRYDEAGAVREVQDAALQLVVTHPEAFLIEAWSIFYRHKSMYRLGGFIANPLLHALLSNVGIPTEPLATATGNKLAEVMADAPFATKALFSVLLAWPCTGLSYLVAQATNAAFTRLQKRVLPPCVPVTAKERTACMAVHGEAR